MKKYALLILLMAITAFGSSQNIKDSLIVHYSFNGDAIDHSGNGFNAVNVGAISGEDRHGNADGALYFDGINDYVLLPNIPQLKPNLPVTFSFWVKTEDIDPANNRFFATDFEFDNYSGFWVLLCFLWSFIPAQSQESLDFELWGIDKGLSNREIRI